MSWIKIDDQMVDHPKIAPLSDRAFRWIHRALSYANRFPANGVLPPAFIDTVPTAVRTELVTAAVWDQGRDGMTRIHDYLVYQPSKAQLDRQRLDTKRRQEKYRLGKVTGKATRESRVTNGAGNRGGHGVTNSAPSRPVPSRSKKNPPTPLADAKGARVLRKHFKDAEAIRKGWGYCQHQPHCETTVSCVTLIAKTLASKNAPGDQGGAHA